MATVKELEAKIAQLEAANAKQEADAQAFLAAFPALLKAALDEVVKPMADEIIHLRGRIDDAARVFVELHKAATPLPAPTTKRIPRDEFDRALQDLRDEAAEEGSSRQFWPVPEIIRRANTLRAMEPA
jgi:uncharacterized membrane protein YheB (UPF0754 family)